MTSVRVLSNAAWVLLQSLSPVIRAFDRPDYDTPSSGQWWVYYPDGGARTNDRTGGISTALAWGSALICAGRTVEQCLTVVDKADTLLTGVQLDADGSCLYPQQNGARVLPETGDPIGPRFSLNRHYQLTTRS